MTAEGLIRTPVPFIMMGVYLLIVIGLSCRSLGRGRKARKGRTQSFEEFYTGNKSMPAFVVGLVTIVTFYSGTTFTGRVGFFCNYGVVALTTLFSSAASGIIMFFLAEKVWPLSKTYHCSTLSDMLELKYQSKYVKLVTALIIVCFNTIWLVTEIRTLGIIVNIASGGVISCTAGAVIAFTIIIAYVCTGGIRSVAAVDSFSSAFMLLGSVAAVIFLVVRFYQGNVASMFSAAMACDPNLWTVSNQGDYGYAYWFSSIVVSTVVMLVYPSNYMSICMGKSVKAVKRASIAAAFSGPWLLIYGIVAAAALGLRSTGVQFQNMEAALLEMVSYSGSGLMLGFVTTFVLAASLGTLDSTLISLSGILSNDVAMNLWNIKAGKPCIGSCGEEKREDRGREVALTRSFILLLGAAALFFSTKQLPLMVLLANYASNGLLQIVPAVLGGLYWEKATPKAAVVSMVSGVACFIGLDTVKRLAFGNAPSFMGGYFLGLPACMAAAVIFVLVSLATYKKSGKAVG